MFLKSLMISKENQIIRDIEFHKGLNLIIDESAHQITGNGVGKTTVLKLVDFCLGADARSIYIDPETKKQEHKLVKDFLIKNKILITLTLANDLDESTTDDIVIERNFLSRKNIIRKINGEQFTEEEFEPKLTSLIFPNHHAEKPTFRQIISHNIRHKDQSINNTLKTLDVYTSDAEYETLYLFLFGCDFDKGNNKQEILTKLKQEYTYKSRLEKNQTKSAYEATLVLINNDIDALNNKKMTFNLNENFESDLDALNNLRYKINIVGAEIGKLTIRKNLIEEAENELKNDISVIDLKQLGMIYQQATNQIKGIQKTFSDLVAYHNQMLQEKINFIVKELPTIINNLKKKEGHLKTLLSDEQKLSKKISKSESFGELENLIIEMNEKYRKKGEYENIVQQLDEVDENIKKYNKELDDIDNELFSDEFEQTVKRQLSKFNIHFAAISNELYGEQYAIKPDKIIKGKNQRLYKFNAFNTNLSSGKKQGEISCFDLAYTQFADDENIPCLHFLLNDKKELMHDNQLVKIARYVNNHNIQFIASILKDKLPDELNNESYFVLKLSESDKLFRIESQQFEQNKIKI